MCVLFPRGCFLLSEGSGIFGNLEKIRIVVRSWLYYFVRLSQSAAFKLFWILNHLGHPFLLASVPLVLKIHILLKVIYLSILIQIQTCIGHKSGIDDFSYVTEPCKIYIMYFVIILGLFIYVCSQNFKVSFLIKSDFF